MILVLALTLLISSPSGSAFVDRIRELSKSLSRPCSSELLVERKSDSLFIFGFDVSSFIFVTYNKVALDFVDNQPAHWTNEDDALSGPGALISLNNDVPKAEVCP